jgi:O-succinylbenzoic acid--CoA ligase
MSGQSSEWIDSGGGRIDPQPIEAALLSYPNVTDAAAFGVRDPGTSVDQIWAAIVVASPIEFGELDRYCRDLLGWKAPGIVLEVNVLPRNADGSLRREELVAIARRMTQPPQAG